MGLPNMGTDALVQPPQSRVEIRVEHTPPTGIENSSALCHDGIGVLRVGSSELMQKTCRNCRREGHAPSLCRDEFSLVSQVAVPPFVHLCERIKANALPTCSQLRLATPRTRPPLHGSCRAA
jgi:hypothetical protein